MKYAIPFEKIPPEYWLFNDLYYRDQYKELKMKRQRMTKRHSNKNFKRGMSLNRKNLSPVPQRGGFRL